MYIGEKEGYGVNVGSKTIYCYHGHPYYVPNGIKSTIEKNDDFVIIKDKKDVPNMTVPHEKNPKYLIYPPAQEYNLIMFLPILTYWQDCNFTADIDIVCPIEKRDIFYGYNVNIIDQEKANLNGKQHYTDIYDFRKYTPTQLQQRVMHLIEFYLGLMQLDKKDMVEKGYLKPVINQPEKNDNGKFVIGVACKGALPMKTWDRSLDRVTEILNRLDNNNYEIWFFDELLNIDKERILMPKLPLYQQVKNIAQCDMIITFGDHNLTYYGGALGINTITFLGPLTQELSIGCFDTVKGFEVALDCRPCIFTKPMKACEAAMPCFNDIGINTVIDAINDQIKSVMGTNKNINRTVDDDRPRK